MHPRSSSRARNTSASVTVTVTVTAAAAAAVDDDDDVVVNAGHSINSWTAEVTCYFERRQEPADGSAS